MAGVAKYSLEIKPAAGKELDALEDYSAGGRLGRLHGYS
jgi:hypothetical protein